MAAQRETIEQASRLHGFVVASWHEDAGRSGASMRRRPGLAAALAEIEAGRAGGIVCAKVDRLGRSAADVLTLAERAQREDWRLVCLDVGLDTATPAGELVLMALSMAARFEFRRISERQCEKHAELRRQGRPRGRPSVTPAVADRMIALRAEGWSLRRIGAHLAETGVVPPQGGRSWYAGSVRAAVFARERERAAQQSRSHDAVGTGVVAGSPKRRGTRRA